jgi:4-hydroxy-3-polyprenylbenzoate decarboxylase
MYDQVARRWTKLGLPGQIPTVRAFEDGSRAITYHEVGGFEPGRQPGETKRPERTKTKRRS